MTKTAYLTIDDAPSPDMRQKIDFLLERGIPAVWFCLGESLEQRPELAIYAIQKGFVIGNHSYNHPFFSETPIAEIRNQIDRTDALVERVYSMAGVTRPAKYFRCPYGDKGTNTNTSPFVTSTAEGKVHKDAIQQHLRARGYTQPKFDDITYRYYRAAGLLDDVDWFWTYDVVEWSIYSERHLYGIDSLEKVYARMEEVLPEDGRGLNTPGSAEIILTHDHVQTTPQFPLIIERLLSKGLKFAMPS